uniref:ATP-dependent DNA helicase n=1 Tax=Lactuca sativa TaxID=4236 RepID=A0A9R1V8Z3_LACSA|nr:hypothetical protein LSAT_V11C600308030 [Lactuca sativa]
MPTDVKKSRETPNMWGPITYGGYLLNKSGVETSLTPFITRGNHGCHDLETDIQKQLKHVQQLRHDFNGLGGAVRQITNFGMAINEGDYMLVAYKHKVNFYKQPQFVINPFNFVSFHDLTARNFDTRIAFDFIGQVVSTEPMRVIKENARETRLMSIVAQDLSGRKMQVALWDGQPQVGNCLFGSRLHINDDMYHISEFKKAYKPTLKKIEIIKKERKKEPGIVDIDLNVESSINTTQLNTKTVVAKPEDYYLRFQIKNIDDIPDYNEEIGLSIIATIIGVFYVFGKVRVVIRVQDETGSASFVLFDRHVKDLIHRGNHWLMEKISKDQGHQKIPDEFNTMLNMKFVFKVQISKFNLQNNYHAYTVHKMTDDGLVVGAVFKHSHAYKESSIHSDGTPINKSIKEKSVSVEGNDVAAMLNKASLIIWDGAPMMHRHCFEAVDRTLRDIILPKNNDKPFGGKTIASLHSSRLWRECTVLRLTVNMRLQFGCPNNDFEETKSFADWILKIGEGTIGGPNDGEVEVEFPEDVIVPSTEVDAINDYMLELMKDEGKTYLSSDSLCETETEDSFEESIYSPGVLNAYNTSGIPNHKLILKKVFRSCCFVISTKPDDYAMVLDYKS